MEKVTLKVEGMSCRHCVNTVESAILELGATANVDFRSNVVNVQYEPVRVTLGKIKEAIEENGYKVKGSDVL